jgi:hypothetical protein
VEHHALSLARSRARRKAVVYAGVEFDEAKL